MSNRSIMLESVYEGLLIQRGDLTINDVNTTHKGRKKTADKMYYFPPMRCKYKPSFFCFVLFCPVLCQTWKLLAVCSTRLWRHATPRYYFLLRVPLVHRSWKATWQSMLHHPDAVKRTEATCTEVYGLWFRAERPFSGNPKAWDHKEVTADNFAFLQHWDRWFLGSHLETSLRLSVNCVTCKRRKWSRQEPSSPERS